MGDGRWAMESVAVAHHPPHLLHPLIPVDDVLAHVDPAVVKYLIVPRGLTFAQLRRLYPGDHLPTLLCNRTIRVTGVHPSNFTLDDTLVTHLDVFNNDAVSIHGIGGVLDYKRYGSGSLSLEGLEQGNASLSSLSTQEILEGTSLISLDFSLGKKIVLIFQTLGVGSGDVGSGPYFSEPKMPVDFYIYHEEKEAFVREADGYEQLARLRGNPSLSRENGSQAMSSGEDILGDGTAPGVGDSIFDIPRLGRSSSNSLTRHVPSTTNDDTYDIFVDDNDNTEPNTRNSSQAPNQ